MTISKTSKLNRLAIIMFMLVVMIMASLTPVLAENSAEYENENDIYGDYNYDNEYENEYEYEPEYQGGWLTIRNHSSATNAPMIDSHFAVFRQHDEQLISIFATDEQGITETLYLLQGEYFLEQQHVQHGYALLPRKYFVIEYGVHLEKSVTNHPIIPTAPWLTITNEPATVMPEGQTQSGYRETGSTISIVSGYAEGWKFTGWSIDGLMRHSEYLSLFFTMPDMDVMITAHWEIYETQEPEPIPKPTPTPTPSLPEPPEPMGRVLLTKRAQGTNELLSGAVFEIRRHMDDTLVATIVTDHFGEATLDLPIGDYFIREIVAPTGFILNPVRIPLRITQDMVTPINVTNAPLPITTPPPDTGSNNEQSQGRLIVTKRAEGTNELLSGAVFEIYRAIDNVFVAEQVTNQFGEATINLPVGDYFLREIIAPRGFVVNSERRTVRITADRITEINIFNAPLPEPELPPPPIEAGRLLITKRDAETNQVLEGAVFEVRRVMDDAFIGHLATNQFGEATIDLMPDNYYLREIIPPLGFVINTDRRNFTISEGQMLSLVIQNYAVITQVVEENGRLLVTVLSSNTGQRIPNAVVTLHDVMTDVQVAELTADQFGEASIFVESGNYFIRQRELPDGYILNFDRFPVTIRPNEMADIMIVARARPAPTATPPPVTPAIPPVQAVPPTDAIADTETLGRLEIITRAEGSGNPLSGGLFAIYTSTDNRRIAQLTTGTGGLAYIELEAGQYFIRELRPTYGFLLEDSRILVDVAEGRVTQIEMTKERNFEIPYLDPDTYGGGIIYIPQTGQDMSLLHYGGGAVLLLISLVSAGFLVLKKGTSKQQSNG